jgi:protocatechuate 3,4-dioxygenase beta subunit
MADDDHFDGNFKRDVSLILNRRLLTFGGLGAAGALLTGCDGWPFSGEANAQGQAADGSTCIKLPQETNGPFPADGTNSRAGATVNVLDKTGIVRPDMRSSFGDYSDVAEGLSLTLEIGLVNVSNACAPLAGHLIYFWQCDAAGQYSLYERTESNCLRGAAITDAQSVARMTTIFPGCYSGRWPHIHFEVFASAEKAASGNESLLISQFAFAKADCEAVYAANSAYAASPAALAELSLESDGIFRDNTPEQLAAQTLKLTGSSDKGYAATAKIGILV